MLNPFDIEAPEGAEDWRDMYPYYVLFSDERRSVEERKFWFYNGMHYPEPMPPFDLITAEAPYVAIGQFQSRVFSTPPVLGIEHRILNGYVYLSTTPVEDPDVLRQRLEVFRVRAGFYYENWNELLAKWHEKITAAIRALEELEIPRLPELEEDAIVFEAHGVGSGYRLLASYNRCLEGYYLIWQLHCELLLLGYNAYLSFFESCRRAFPDISLETVAKMVSGFDVIMFRPDDELKRLAAAALQLGVDDILSREAAVQEVWQHLSETEAGRAWLTEFEESKDPWFNVSVGDGFYHHHRSWADDLRFPLSAIATYISRLRSGENVDRDTDGLRRERDRITGEYFALLSTEEDRKAFADTLALARLVFPHVEEHKFYCEHWGTTAFFRKVREIAGVLVEEGFLPDREDIFFLHHHEVYDALSDCVLAWSAGSLGRGPGYWPAIIERRKQVLARLTEWNPPAALGPVPETVEDPLLVMLWGVSIEQLSLWANPMANGTRHVVGYGASPGVVEGRARVIRRIQEVSTVEDGEILVCPVTAPSWGPVFPKIRAAVSDIGGMMSHAAIIAREYGLPAVVGTGHATKLIETGQRIRVDGSTGVVAILPGPAPGVSPSSRDDSAVSEPPERGRQT